MNLIIKQRLKVDYPNVIYALSYYHPVSHHAVTEDDQEVWEGTKADIDEQSELLQPAIDFSNTFDVSLNVLELGITMERQDQLDKFELKLELLEENRIGWCYWWCSWYYEDFISFNLFNEDGSPKQENVDLLTDYREWMYWDSTKPA